MAVELGCSPESLLDLDLALFNETAKALTEKKQREVEEEGWTQDTELLATAVELLHAQLISFIRANSKDAPDVEPLRIPRPERFKVSEQESEPETASHEQILDMARRGGAL